MNKKLDFNIGRKLMSDYKFYSSYSKYDEILKRKESWNDSVERIFNMHAVKYSDKISNNEEFFNLFSFAKDKYKEKLVLGSQRALQFGGEPILKHESKLYNCITGYCDRVEFFQEAMYWLLSGCGVGFSVQHKHIEKLPKIKKRSNRSKVFTIHDSIEGWSDAIGVLISSYVTDNATFEKYQGVKVLFDYTQIRPKGAYISGGFKAPGHEGLRNTIQRIEELLDGELSRDDFNGVIRPIIAYDIVMHISDAVLSGGVRRSATIALFSPTDIDMLKAKTGNWFIENPQRARSNNTVLLNRNTLTKEDFAKFFDFVREYGEPGFGFTDDEDIIFNPCFEIGMMPKTEEGESGWQGCVSYNTPLITKDGLIEIGKASDEKLEIEIWNGVKWTKVTPFQTGKNRKLYRVSFSDGSYLDVTDNHKFLVKTKEVKDFSEKETLELIELIKNDIVLELPLTNVINDSEYYEEFAYKYGKVCGKNVNAELPKNIFKWSTNTLLDFLNGWSSVFVEGNDENKATLKSNIRNLKTLQLVLTKNGIYSEIERWYNITTDAVDYFLKVIDKPIPQTIISIEENDGLHNSYCFEEPETHNGMFGNVLTKQCNLVEINGGMCDTEEKFYDACKAASIMATIQAGYTDFKYVSPTTKQIFEREALLGVSITGMMNNPTVLFDKHIQRKGAEIVKKYNRIVAEMMNINPAARTTCIKPSGNASVLLETASGIHGEKAKKYIRNVQANKEDEYVKLIKLNNPKMVENSVWSSTNSDYVVSFPIINDNKSIFSNELYGTKLLNYVKLTQENWVEYGTNEDLCVHPKIRHNVSNTIEVDDWDKVEEYLFDNRYSFAGVSLLPLTGDKDYNQAPFTAVYDAEELVEKYGVAVLFASGLIVDGLKAFNDNLWLACDTVLGNGEVLEYSDTDVERIINNTNAETLWKNLGFKNGTLNTLVGVGVKPEIEEYKRYLDSKITSNQHAYVLKRDWVRRAKQFSERYFLDIKEMTYCLKDVNNFHRWVEIIREYKDVNFQDESIKPIYTKIDSTAALACSGGACEINF